MEDGEDEDERLVADRQLARDCNLLLCALAAGLPLALEVILVLLAAPPPRGPTPASFGEAVGAMLGTALDAALRSAVLATGAGAVVAGALHAGVAWWWVAEHRPGPWRMVVVHAAALPVDLVVVVLVVAFLFRA